MKSTMSVGVVLKSMLGSLLLVLLSSNSIFAQQNLTSASKPIAFTHVTVIDATGAPAQPDMTIVVSSNRITGLGKTGSVAIPKAAQLIDAKGKFMIPGLWDMHEHAFTEKNQELPLYSLWENVVNGVTGVRDMGDHGTPTADDDRPYFDNFEWRQAIASGSIIGPRLVLAGALLEGAPSARKGWIEIGNAAQGREAVDKLKKWGVDFIKVHNNLSRESYFAIAEESKKQGIAYSGHLTNTVSAAEASDAGQKSLEHLQGVLVNCSTQESEMMKALQEEGGEPALLHHSKPILATYSDEKCRALFAKLVKNDTYVTPTLVRERVAPISMNDPRLAYASPNLRKEYQRSFDGFKRREGDVPDLKKLHAAHYRVVKEMQEAGVKLMAGTDGHLFGYDLRDEMVEMVAAGLTPMQALQTATKNPAEYFGKLDSMGTIEKSKVADLVLLDANPLDSIENTLKIRSVVLNGRLLDRNALDLMQALIKTGTNASGTNPTTNPTVGYGDVN